jgi:hypothetical protein
MVVSRNKIFFLTIKNIFVNFKSNLNQLIMKIKLLLSFLVVFLMYSTSYASFPVKRTVTASSSSEMIDKNTETVLMPITSSAAEKDLVVGIVLWFFLGWAAGHRWYYGKPVLYNILFIVTLGGLGVWWVIDLVNMIQGKF